MGIGIDIEMVPNRSLFRSFCSKFVWNVLLVLIVKLLLVFKHELKSGEK